MSVYLSVSVLSAAITETYVCLCKQLLWLLVSSNDFHSMKGVRQAVIHFKHLLLIYSPDEGANDSLSLNLLLRPVTHDSRPQLNKCLWLSNTRLLQQTLLPSQLCTGKLRSTSVQCDVDHSRLEARLSLSVYLVHWLLSHKTLQWAFITLQGG